MAEVHPLLQGVVASLDDDVKRIQALRRRARKAGALVQRLQDAVAGVRAMWPLKVRSLNVSNSYSTIYVSVSVADLQGFKDQPLLDMLEAVEEIIPFRSTSDWPSSMSRDYCAYDAVTQLEFRVCAVANGDQATCIRKVVGWTKPEEPRPIFGLECE